MSEQAHPSHGTRAPERRPLVSVVLPNCNHVRSLPEAISALEGQDPPPDEIIVIDDCSSDESVPLLRRIAQVVPTLRLLTNPENLGVVASLNRGIAAASGNYVYLGAADDWVFPGFFSRAVAALQAHPDLPFYCGESALYDAKSRRLIGIRPAARPTLTGGRVSSDAYVRLLRGSDNHILTGSSLFRRASLGRALDESLGSFADGFMTRKLALDAGFYYEPRVVAAWVVDSASVSRRTATDHDLAMRSLELFPRRIASDPVFPDWYAECFERRWRFTVARLALGKTPADRDLFDAVARAQLPRLPAHIGVAPDRLGGAARFLMVTWLLWRLRPFTATGMLRMLISQLLQLDSRVSARHAWPKLAPSLAAAISSRAT